MQAYQVSSLLCWLFSRKSSCTESELQLYSDKKVSKNLALQTICTTVKCRQGADAEYASGEMADAHAHSGSLERKLMRDPQV